MAPLDALGPAHDEGHRLMNGVTDWTVSTPCSDWDAAALVRHEVAGNRIFAARLADVPVDPVALDAELGQVEPGDLPAAFLTSARALEGAFAAPGAMSTEIDLRIGRVPAAAALHLRLVETLVHGWDLARATGQSPAFDDDLVEAEIAASTMLLQRIPAGRSPFAPSVPIDAGAPPLDRLVALLGRAPGTI